MSGDRRVEWREGAGFGPCAVCEAPGAFGLGWPAKPREARRWWWACGERCVGVVQGRIAGFGTAGGAVALETGRPVVAAE
jgi:hypothetical protein